MKIAGAVQLSSEELMNLKVGDVVWYCPLFFKSRDWDGDLEQGRINEIFRRSDRRKQVIALDLVTAPCDVKGFIIDCYQVPVGNLYKSK